MFWYFNWSYHHVKLEDLYVKPEYRSQGVGKAFFGQLGKIAQEKVTVSLLHSTHISEEFSLFYHRPFLFLIVNTVANYCHIKNCARLDWSVLKVSLFSWVETWWEFVTLSDILSWFLAANPVESAVHRFLWEAVRCEAHVRMDGHEAWGRGYRRSQEAPLNSYGGMEAQLNRDHRRYYLGNLRGVCEKHLSRTPNWIKDDRRWLVYMHWHGMVGI